jgi:phage terminase small subunit
MSSPSTSIILETHTGHRLTPQEHAFINSYLLSGNASQAVKDAGYKAKTAPQYARALLHRDYIREEIQYLIKEREDKKTADRTEILQFYTSVMRGEQLDQFGIEASLDTRIKAANELAKHIIEIPLKLEQKNTQNNIGSIQINFVARE